MLTIGFYYKCCSYRTWNVRLYIIQCFNIALFLWILEHCNTTRYLSTPFSANFGKLSLSQPLLLHTSKLDQKQYCSQVLHRQNQWKKRVRVLDEHSAVVWSAESRVRFLGEEDTVTLVSTAEARVPAFERGHGTDAANKALWNRRRKGKVVIIICVWWLRRCSKNAND